MNRRKFFTGAAAATGGALLARMVPTARAAEPGMKATSTGTTAPFVPPADWKGYKPVITPNGLTLPFKTVNGVKVYHLVAEPVTHEFAPGLVAECWGYNNRVHGPTIEAVEGDRVRIYVTNRLTTRNWHPSRQSPPFAACVAAYRPTCRTTLSARRPQMT